MSVRAINDGTDKVIFDYEGCLAAGASSKGVETLEQGPCEVDPPEATAFDDVVLSGVALGLDGPPAVADNMQYVTGIATCQFDGGVRVVTGISDRATRWLSGNSGPLQTTTEIVPR